MEAYSEFAKVYDTFMEDTPYEKWIAFMEHHMKKYNISPRIVCDLGCGTGKMCGMFAERGIEMIGIDSSEEMLMVARENAMEEGHSILYLMQDMSDFELYGTVDMIYSCCDSINYLLEEDEVLNTFKWVNNYLEPRGLFIFDINTYYKYENILSDQTFAEQTEDAAYIWENYFDKEEEINEFIVNFFLKDSEGKYDRTEEYHYQRAYSIEKIKELLKRADLELIGVYDDYNSEAPYHESTQRATFVAREQGKRKE
ncbi:MAG: Methyltransferase type 11 [Clostridia bacterium]|jgi:ubiquinone/menaquinone biosynthesis C-methylase UbiE|nr:Methyltransferase type 11 [Clostridia bacterium]